MRPSLVVRLVTTCICPVPWRAQSIVSAEGPGWGTKAGGCWGTCGQCPALLGVSCAMPVLATAHYYSRYEFEVSQRVPKVIMGRHQRCLPLLVAPDSPCGKDDDDGENIPDTAWREHPRHCMPQPGSVTLADGVVVGFVLRGGCLGGRVTPGSLRRKLGGLWQLSLLLLRPPCDAQQ